MNLRKNLHYIATAAILLNCAGAATSSETAVTTDSAATVATIDSVTSTSSVQDVDYAIAPEEEFVVRVEHSVDSMIEIKKTMAVYSLSGSFNGYENSADATYYFDSLFSLVYCEISWSNEGISGSGIYFFDADEVDGGRASESGGDTEENTVFYSIFQPQYGVVETLMAEYNPAYSIFDQSSFISVRSAVKDDYNRLVNRILEHKDDIVLTEDDASLDLENETDSYGETFTEREAFRMPIEVYEKVIKPEF
jgi:hypothetical protein